ncbi:MAG: hypothetical protein AAF909_11740, partial [Pseudomonadota bacterium]
MRSGGRSPGADGAPVRVEEPPLSAEDARALAAERAWAEDRRQDDGGAAGREPRAVDAGATAAKPVDPTPQTPTPLAEPLQPANAARILPTDWRSAWIVFATAAAMGFLAALFL